MRALCLALLALACPAHAADCPSADAATYGLSVKTQNGDTWSFGAQLGSDGISAGIEGQGHGTPLSGYSISEGYKIFALSEPLARRIAGPEVLADKRAVFASLEITGRGAPAPPNPGTFWTGKGKIEVSAQQQNWTTIPVATLPVQMRYDYLPLQDVVISGCPYTVMPIEYRVTGANGEVLVKRRMIHFPLMDLAVITRWGPDAEGPERKTGITGLGYDN